MAQDEDLDLFGSVGAGAKHHPAQQVRERLIDQLHRHGGSCRGRLRIRTGRPTAGCAVSVTVRVRGDAAARGGAAGRGRSRLHHQPVLGLVLSGMIAAMWGMAAAFGLITIPGLHLMVADRVGFSRDSHDQEASRHECCPPHGPGRTRPRSGERRLMWSPLVDDALPCAGPLSRDSGPVQRTGRHQGRDRCRGGCANRWTRHRSSCRVDRR